MQIGKKIGLSLLGVAFLGSSVPAFPQLFNVHFQNGKYHVIRKETKHVNKKKKPDHGKRTKAGQLLSQFIRKIALEETELIKGGSDKDRMATKAEALARMVWQRALGFTEQKVVSGELVDIEHSHDRVYVGMLWDRMEGRAPLMNPEKGNKRTIVDKVSEQGIRRLNQIAEES